MKLSKIFFGAIEVIRKRGWCQSALELQDGSVCMIGAMRVSSKGFAEDARKYFTDTVFPTLIVVDVNDFSCKTADDACAFLEIAACCAVVEGK